MTKVKVKPLNSSKIAHFNPNNAKMYSLTDWESSNRTNPKWRLEAMYKPSIRVVYSNERLITPSGLSIVGGMLGKSDFVKRCNRIPIDKKRSEPQIKDGDILLASIGLLCQAKTQFDTVNELMDDPEYFKEALGNTRSIPSAETLRQRMDDIS